MAGIDTARIEKLNDREEREGSYVLYWMQASQRHLDNHALEFAIEQANRRDRSVLVGFGLTAGYPDANLRHYHFMLEGLTQTADGLSERGIKLVVRLGDPADVALELAADACLVVCDRGYLRFQKEWRHRVAEQAPCAVIQVESDVVVPVRQASDKREYAARTIRPKLQRQKDGFCRLPDAVVPAKSSLPLHVTGEDVSDVDGLLSRLDLDRSVGPVPSFFSGGPDTALARFRDFLDQKLSVYSAHRNQPQTDDSSHMSPYLHFGQVSPIRLIADAESRMSGAGEAEKESLEEFTEELMVRRELSINYCEYEPAYDQFTSLPDWALKTLAEHAGDERPTLYSLEQLEQSQTHDEYWNA
jgi:deoxyribodipyrimidine photo-lyase